MNKQFFPMAAISIGLTFSSCSKIKGDGSSVTEIRTAKGFSSIRAAMSGDVYVRQDSVFKIEIHGQKNIIDLLNTTVSNGELKIDFDFNKRIGLHDKIEVFISCPVIRKLSVSGSGNITGMNSFTPATMDMNVSGSGSISIPEINSSSINAKISGSGAIIVLNGKVSNAITELSGSGYIDLIGVQSYSATVNTSGSGDTKIKVQDDLHVKVSGSGDVYYRGTPRITTNISGSGKLKSL